jgi:hypothetical protein
MGRVRGRNAASISQGQNPRCNASHKGKEGEEDEQLHGGVLVKDMGLELEIKSSSCCSVSTSTWREFEPTLERATRP